MTEVQLNVSDEPEFHRLRVTCPDGLAHTTSVTVDGKNLDGVQRVDLSIDANTGVTVARLVVHFVELDFDAPQAAQHVYTVPRPAGEQEEMPPLPPPNPDFAAITYAERGPR